MIIWQTFVENLTVDCIFNTHHISSINLTGVNFLARKDSIIAALENQIQNGDLDKMSEIRRNKKSL